MFDQSTIDSMLPVKTPFLMVDSIVSYQNAGLPRLFTERKINDTDPMYAYQGVSKLLPSVYLIEGLAQTAILLGIISSFEQLKVEMNIGSSTSLSTFINTNLDKLQAAGERNQSLAASGLLALVDIEITGQVFLEDLLLFEVELQKVYADKSKFGVKALVRDKEVANGFLIGSRSNRTALQ